MDDNANSLNPKFVVTTLEEFNWLWEKTKILQEIISWQDDAGKIDVPVTITQTCKEGSLHSESVVIQVGRKLEKDIRFHICSNKKFVIPKVDISQSKVDIQIASADGSENFDVTIQ